jgi:hypothetical protein
MLQNLGKSFSRTIERCRVHLFKSQILLWREHFLDEHKKSEYRKGEGGVENL